MLQDQYDVAKKPHNGQANPRHRNQKGQLRFGVRNGRTWEYSCADYAKTIVSHNIARLEKLLNALAFVRVVMENVLLQELLWRGCFRRKPRPRQVAGDTTYGTIEAVRVTSRSMLSADDLPHSLDHQS